MLDNLLGIDVLISVCFCGWFSWLFVVVECL